MNVSLTPELEQLIQSKVQSGMYQTASEVVRAGLRLLQQQDEDRERRLRELRSAVDIGLDQIARGQYTDYEPSDLGRLLEEIKAAGRARMSASQPEDHFYFRASQGEFNRALDELAEMNRGLPILADDAFDRESLYEEAL